MAAAFLLSDSLMQPPARAQAMTAHSELSAPGFVVIVLDDDLAVRNSLKFSLEIEGFTVRSYATGAELLDAADPPDCGCLVVDQHMPGMSGLDLHRRLVALGTSIPTVLITAFPGEEARTRGLGADIICSLTKPFREQDLVDCILSAVARGSDGQSGKAGI